MVLVKILGGLSLALNAAVTFWLLKSALSVFRKGGIQVKFLITVVVPFFLALLLGTAFHIYRVSATDPTNYLSFLVLGLAVLYMMVAAGFGALLYLFNKQLSKQPGRDSGDVADALRQSERMLLFSQFAVDHVRDPAIWLSLQRDVLYFNLALSDLLGYSEPELTAMEIEKWFPSVPDYWFDVSGRLSQHESLSQALLITKDGRQLSVQVQYWRLQERQDSFVFLTLHQKIVETSASVDVSSAPSTSLGTEVRNECRSLLEHLAEMVFLYTFDGVLIEFNQTACTALGYEAQEFAALSMKDIDTNYIDGELWRHRLSSSPVSISTVYKSKSGDTTQVDVRLSLLDWDGATLILATAWNAKERLQREASLKQSELTLRSLFDTLSSAVLVVDLRGRLIDVNSTTLQYFALTKPHLLELNIANLLDLPSLPQPFTSFWREVLEGNPQLFDARVKSFAGDSTFPAQLDIRRIKIGSMDYVIVEMQENEEIDRLKRMVQLRQEQFQVVVELSGIGFANWDIGSGLLYWSDVLERLFGLEPQSFDKSYDTFISLVHPEDRTFIDQHIRRCVHEGIDFCVEFRVSPQVTDTLTWIKLQGLVVTDLKGKPVRVVQAAQDITLYKQHEDILLQHESKWRTWVQNSSDWITVQSPAGIIWYSSPAVESILGYLANDVQGRNLYDYVHPDDRRNLEQAFSKMVKMPPGQSVTIEYRCIHSNGEWRYLETRGANLTTQEDIGGFVLNTRDISDRKYTEIALSQSVANNRALMVAMPDLLLHLNSQGLCLRVVTGSEWALYSSITSQWMEESITSFFPQDYLSRLYEAMSNLFAVNEPQSFEHPLNLDGYQLVVESRLSPYRDGECVLLLRNVTDRSTVQAVRAQYETTNRALLEAIPDLIIYSDINGRFLDVIPAKTFDTIATDDWDGKTVYDVLPHALAEQRLQAIREALKTKNSVIYDQEIDTAQGVRHEEVRVVPIKNDTVLCIIRDVSYSRDAQADLQWAKQRCQQILENVQKSLWAADPEGRLLFVSRELADLYGYEPEEMVGKPLTDFHPANINGYGVEDFLCEVSSTGNCVQGEVMQRKKSGDAFRLFLNACALKDDFGQITWIAGVALSSTIEIPG